MYGKTKEETIRMNREFMLNPKGWPATGFFTRIYLKRYNPEKHYSDMAQLVYDEIDGQWSFCRDDALTPDIDSIRNGGSELIEAILEEGWVVD